MVDKKAPSIVGLFYLKIFKYLSVMDKKQLLKGIEDAGLTNTFSQLPEWVQAFEAYAKATGLRKDMKCGTCYREVLQWLRA